MDVSNVHRGLLYGYLQNKIVNTFGDGNGVVLVDVSSVNKLSDGSMYKFKYEVKFDFRLM